MYNCLDILSMTPVMFTGLAFAASAAAGVLGSLLGLGGGIVIVPVLTLLLHINIRYAIGASIVAVIATSSGAAAAYVRDHMTNLRVAMFLELATTSGAISGAYLAGVVSKRWLYIIFGVVMAWSAFAMLSKRGHEERGLREVTSSRIADLLALHDSYFDPAKGELVSYRVARPGLGLGLMYLAGATSGLLGIGSGALKVPAMDLAMGLPIKVSTATSNFMIGVTAAASAGVYLARGDIDPFIAAPVAAGVLVGALAGSRLLGRIRSASIRALFVAVLLWVSFEMVMKGLR
jgi:uncharacterized membrane protein YfcA